MKKAKEYLDTLKWNLIAEDTAVEGITIKHAWILESDAEKLIKQAQIDAIEATVLKCAQLGEIDDGQYHLIVKQLKKELE